MRNKETEKDFIDMIKLYERVIYKVVSIYANANQTTGDLYQEVVLNLWKAYPSFRGDSKVSTWIYRITLNTCLTFLKRKRIDTFYTDSIPDIAELPDNGEDVKELYLLISRLNNIERALILLYLEDKSYKEISEITDLTVTNVATKLSRIKEKLIKMSNK